MTETTSDAIKSNVKVAAKKAEYSPLMEALTRLGFGVRGVIYMTMGILAFKLVLGKGGSLVTQKEAIAAIGSQPAGRFMLWIVLVGLISYALWGVVRALMDPLHKGRDLKGLVTRFGYLVSAFGYSVLVPTTYGYIKGGSASSGSSIQKFIAQMMALPLGRWVVGILGLAFVIGGFYQIYQGVKANFDRQFKVYALTAWQAKTATGVARFGTVARGVVYGVAGGLVMLAAIQANPNQPADLDAALAALLKLPFGIWILGVVALGLVAFGFYSMLSALWFRLKI